jgi:hypothetical protein
MRIRSVFAYGSSALAAAAADCTAILFPTLNFTMYATATLFIALRYNHAYLSKCMSKKRNAEKRGLLLLQIYFTFHGRIHVTEKSSSARHFLAMLVVTRTSGSICSRCVNALGNTHVNKINRAVR